jgi:hypothetical protein
VALTRGCRLAGITGLILGVMGVMGAQGGALNEPPATSLLRIPVAGSRQKPPVKFSHQRHEAVRVACTQCHHEYRNRRNVWHKGLPAPQCPTCHGLRPEARRLDLKNAYHRQCKGCHLRLGQQGRAAGPIECRGCHRPPERGGLTEDRDARS